VKWRQTTVTSFDELVDEIHKLMPPESAPDEVYWFRGQSNYKWSLDTSYMRCSKNLGLSDQDLVDLETAARLEFRSKAHLFVKPSLLEKVKTTPCWWALMQHHGAPTRLLDWSVSPFVAAYFAVQQDTSGKSGAVWCFCSDHLKESFKKQPGGGSLKPFDEEGAGKWYDDLLTTMKARKIVVPLSFSLASSERMVAQQGKFTMCFSVNEAHDCIMTQIESKSLRKIIIPHDIKAEFLLRLRIINITGGSLFPGVDGLGQSVRELVSLGKRYQRCLP